MPSSPSRSSMPMTPVAMVIVGRGLILLPGHTPGIDRQAHNAIGVDAPKVGLHQAFGAVGGILRRQTGLVKDVSGKALQQ